MLVVGISLLVWIALSVALAITLGRIATRADLEELGSGQCWDIREIDGRAAPSATTTAE